MHTQHYDYTDEDKEYSYVDNISPRSPRTVVNFHYNSDLSGEVKIQVLQVDGFKPGGFREITEEINIPAWMLLEFVGRFVQSEAISSIEDMSGRDFLSLMKAT